MSDYIINSGKLPIDGTDYLTLRYDKLLTSGIMNRYLEYFMDRIIPHHLREDVYIFPCEFCNDLVVKGNFNEWFEGDNEFLKDEEKRYKRVEFYLEQINIFSKRFLMVSCLDVTSHHWFVAVIRNERVVIGSTASMSIEILIMDSASSQLRATEAVKHLSNLLNNEYHSKYASLFTYGLKILQMSETKQPNDLVDLFDGNEITSVFLNSTVAEHVGDTAFVESMDHCDGNATTSAKSTKQRHMDDSTVLDSLNLPSERRKSKVQEAQSLQSRCFVYPSSKKLAQHMKWHESVAEGKKNVKACLLRCSANIPCHMQKNHYKLVHGLR